MMQSEGKFTKNVTIVNLSIKSNLFYSFFLFIDGLKKSVFLNWKIMKFSGPNFHGCPLFCKFHGTYCRNLWPKFQKLISRKFFPAHISALEVCWNSKDNVFSRVWYFTGFSQSHQHFFLFHFIIQSTIYTFKSTSAVAWYMFHLCFLTYYSCISF